jgi:hypothetical protein
MIFGVAFLAYAISVVYIVPFIISREISLFGETDVAEYVHACKNDKVTCKWIAECYHYSFSGEKVITETACVEYTLSSEDWTTFVPNTSSKLVNLHTILSCDYDESYLRKYELFKNVHLTDLFQKFSRSEVTVHTKEIQLVLYRGDGKLWWMDKCYYFISFLTLFPWLYAIAADSYVQDDYFFLRKKASGHNFTDVVHDDDYQRRSEYEKRLSCYTCFRNLLAYQIIVLLISIFAFAVIFFLK